MKSRVRVLLFALAAVAATALLAAACGGDSSGDSGGEDEVTNPGALPTPGPGGYSVVLSTADLAVGQARVAFVVFKDDKPVTDTAAFVRFFKIGANNQSTLKGSGPIPWAPLGVDSTEDHGAHNDTELTGVYYVNIAFDEAGKWGLGVSLGDKLDEKGEVRLAIEVRAKSQAPSVGSKAISAKNLTLRDAPLGAIDTSPEPDEAFHQLSIADALASGKPSVIAFATPSFCETRTCGPSMEVVTEAAKVYQGKVNFVHVEPYKLDSEGVLTFGPGTNGSSLRRASPGDCRPNPGYSWWTPAARWSLDTRGHTPWRSS